MTWILLIILCLALILVFSQFGGRLSASGALQWWLVAFFLLVAAINPELYRPMTDLLGIRFVSNFVLAGMVMFLFSQALELAAGASSIKRDLRLVVSGVSADQYYAASPLRAEGPQSDCLVVLPCFNEQGALPGVIENLDRLCRRYPQIRYCFVDDGSQDGTRELLRTLAPGNFVSHLCNVGVSGALQTGFLIGQRLGVTHVVQCDADGQHPVESIPQLLNIARETGSDCLIGSRYVEQSAAKSHEQGTTAARRTGGWLISWTLRVLGPSGARVADPTSGFRVYSQKAVAVLLRNMPDEYPEPESIAVMALNKLRIRESEVKMSPRTAGQSTLAGVKSLFYMVKVVTAILGLRLRILIGPA